MTMTKAIIALAAPIAMGGIASASTTQAWAALDRQVDRACINASGLSRAKIVADKASFPDRVPIELRVVEGYNRQSVVDVRLCAYDRSNRHASTVEGSGRLGVNRH